MSVLSRARAGYRPQPADRGVFSRLVTARDHGKPWDGFREPARVPSVSGAPNVHQSTSRRWVGTDAYYWTDWDWRPIHFIAAHRDHTPNLSRIPPFRRSGDTVIVRRRPRPRYRHE